MEGVRVGGEGGGGNSPLRSVFDAGSHLARTATGTSHILRGPATNNSLRYNLLSPLLAPHFWDSDLSKPNKNVHMMRFGQL